MSENKVLERDAAEVMTAVATAELNALVKVLKHHNIHFKNRKELERFVKDKLIHVVTEKYTEYHLLNRDETKTRLFRMNKDITIIDGSFNLSLTFETDQP